MENEKKEEAEEAGSSWWDSWYDSAKKKLTETNEFMMRDMREFTQAVKEDASRIVASTAAQMKDQLNININLEEASEATKTVTNSLTDFLGKVVQQVSPQNPDDSDDDSFLLGTRNGVKMLNPSEARLYHLQTNPETYCTGPDNDLDYEEWVKEFSIDNRKEEISTLMLDFKEVRSIYTKLVPEAVSHSDFWTRYFYKKSLHEKAEERRAKLVERAAMTSANLSWDDDDDDDLIGENKPSCSTSPSTSKLEISPPSATGDAVVETTNIPPQNTETKPEEVEKPTEEKPKIEVKEEVLSIPENKPETKEIVEDVISNVEKVELDTCEHTIPSSSPVVDDDPPPTPTPPTNDNTNSSPTLSKNNIECDDKSETTTLSSKEASSCEIIESADFKSPKDSSSGNSSDWEKEFDIDMTEEEISNVLQQTTTVEDDEVDDDWEGWE